MITVEKNSDYLSPKAYIASHGCFAAIKDGVVTNVFYKVGQDDFSLFYLCIDEAGGFDRRSYSLVCPFENIFDDDDIVFVDCHVTNMDVRIGLGDLCD